MFSDFHLTHSPSIEKIERRIFKASFSGINLIIVDHNAPGKTDYRGIRIQTAEVKGFRLIADGAVNYAPFTAFVREASCADYAAKKANLDDRIVRARAELDAAIAALEEIS